MWLESGLDWSSRASLVPREQLSSGTFSKQTGANKCGAVEQCNIFKADRSKEVWSSGTVERFQGRQEQTSVEQRNSGMYVRQTIANKAMYRDVHVTWAGWHAARRLHHMGCWHTAQRRASPDNRTCKDEDAERRALPCGGVVGDGEVKVCHSSVQLSFCCCELAEA
eukprot:362265-Chlamydomonas_euryale.AAC.17